jgi:hypothetical protein
MWNNHPQEVLLINDQRKRKKMSDPRYTDNSRRDLNHDRALNVPRQSNTGGIVAAVIAALLIVGGTIPSIWPVQTRPEALSRRPGLQLCP